MLAAGVALEDQKWHLVAKVHDARTTPDRFNYKRKKSKLSVKGELQNMSTKNLCCKQTKGYVEGLQQKTLLSTPNNLRSTAKSILSTFCPRFVLGSVRLRTKARVFQNAQQKTSAQSFRIFL